MCYLPLLSPNWPIQLCTDVQFLCVLRGTAVSSMPHRSKRSGPRLGSKPIAMPFECKRPVRVCTFSWNLCRSYRARRCVASNRLSKSVHRRWPQWLPSDRRRCSSPTTYVVATVAGIRVCHGNCRFHRSHSEAPPPLCYFPKCVPWRPHLPTYAQHWIQRVHLYQRTPWNFCRTSDCDRCRATRPYRSDPKRHLCECPSHRLHRPAIKRMRPTRLCSTIRDWCPWRTNVDVFRPTSCDSMPLTMPNSLHPAMVPISSWEFLPIDCLKESKPNSNYNFFHFEFYPAGNHIWMLTLEFHMGAKFFLCGIWSPWNNVLYAWLQYGWILGSERCDRFQCQVRELYWRCAHIATSTRELSLEP